MRTTLIIFSFVILVSSCNSITFNNESRIKNTQKKMDSNHFDQALEIIKATPEEHKNHEELINLIPEIRKNREIYIRSTLEEAEQHEKQLNWYAALAIIENGLKNLPNSEEFILQHQRYEQKVNERIDMDKAAILIAKAQFYISAQPYWESLLHSSNANFLKKRHYKQFLKEANVVSNELLLLGQRYWSQQQITQAKETLRLATRTSQNTAAESLLTDINEFQRQEAVASGRVIELDLESTKLEQSFLEKLSENNFSGAQYILNEMTARNLPLIKQKQALLAQQKKETSETYKAKGHALYNAGSIKEAIHLWEQALALTPEDNGLQQQLERAKRFLNNLERWQDDE